MSRAKGDWFWVVLLAAAILAAFSQRLTVNATVTEPNIWDVAVPVQTDLYLLAYLFLPVWILRLTLVLPDWADEIWLLRCGSRLRWITHSGRWALSQSVTLLMIWLTTSFVIAAGLPLATGWSHLADPDGREVVQAALQSIGIGPLLGWGLQWAAYLGLLLVIFLVLALTTLLTGTTWIRYLSAVLVYLLMVVAIRSGLQAGDLMFIYQAAAVNATIWKPILAPAVFGTLLLAGFICFERLRRSSAAIELRQFGSIAAYFAIVIFGLGATALNLGSELDLSDLLLAAFYGFDVANLNLGVYSFFLITFSGFTLLYLIAAEQRLWPLYLLISIRSGSARRWMLRAWLEITFSALAVVLAILAAAVLIVAALGHPSPNGTELGLHVYQFAVNGALQLVVVTGITFVVAYLTKSRTALVATISVIAVIQVPMINIDQMLPVGLNALGLASDWRSAIHYTIYLSVAVAATIGLSLIACSHSARRALERISA